MEDASEAKKLANEDTAEGSTTTRDASPDSIAPNEEENSIVGGTQEEGQAGRPSNRKKKDVSSAEGEGMTKYNDHAPAPQNTTEAIERSKEGSCSKALISQNQMQEVHTDALDVNENKDEGSTTAGVVSILCNTKWTTDLSSRQFISIPLLCMN